MRINRPRGKTRLVHLGGYSLRPTVQQHTVERQSPATANEWVERNLKKVQKFSGQWVAVTKVGVVAHSKDFDDVFARAKAQGVTNPLVFKAPKPTTVHRVVSGRKV